MNMLYDNEKKTTTLNKKKKLFVFLAVCLFSLYANLFPCSISIATAQEIEPPSCSLNDATTQERDEALKAAATGDMAGIIFPQTAYYAGNLRFKNELGEWLSLDRFQGKAVLVNLWATWCGPCRDEMPELGILQQQLGDENFEVVAINLDSGGDEKAQDFLRVAKADNLALYRDASMAVFQDVRRAGLARGLPTTLLLDKTGCLVATLVGSAPWGGEDALAFIRILKGE